MRQLSNNVKEAENPIRLALPSWFLIIKTTNIELKIRIIIPYITHTQSSTISITPWDNVNESRRQTTMSQAPMSELYSNHASILIFIGRMIQVCSVVIPPLWIMETTIYHYTPLKFGYSHDLTWMLNLLHLGILIQLYTVGESCSSPDISCTPPCISRDIYMYHAHIHQSTYVIQL